MQRKLISTALLLQGFLYLMVCVPCLWSHFSCCFEDLMFLRLADSFQNLFERCGTVSPEITHTSPSYSAHLSLTLLSPFPPSFFTLFLHIHLFIRTNALVLYPISQCWQTSWAPWVTPTLTSGPQVEQSYWEPETQSPWAKLLLGMYRKMLKLSCLPWGDQFHMCHKCHHPTPSLSMLAVRGPLEQSLSAHGGGSPLHPWAAMHQEEPWP